MNITRILGALLVVAGVLGAIYGGFSYTREETQAKLGPLELKVEDKETVTVPLWASVAAIAVGGVLLFVGRR